MQDSWSLDVEGAELPILKFTNFSAFRFGVMTVETSTVSKTRRICRLLEEKGFAQLHHSLAKEVTFFDPLYFRMRGIAVPQHAQCE